MQPTPLFASFVAVLSAASPAISQKITTLTSAPRIGTTMKVTYAGTASDPYLMLIAAPSATQINVPGIGGSLLLDPNTVFVLYVSVVGAGGTDTQGIGIPNDTALVGVGVDLQPLNVAAGPVFDFGVNKVQVTVVAGIGTIVPVEGTSTATTTGNLVVERVSNPEMGVPASQGIFASAFQPIRHYGQAGYVEGFAADFSATFGNSDINLWRRDRVARDTVNVGMSTVALPNGYDLAIVRDNANQRQFSLLSIRQSTGAAQVLTGSTVIDTSATAAPVSMYRPQVGFTDDGTLAACVVHDSTTTAPLPPDRVFLVKTDGSTWAASGTAVLDISPTGAAVGTLWFDNTTFFANGRVFCGGSLGWNSAPIDGSAKLAPITLPNTGTNQTNKFVYSPSWRISADRKTVVIPIGGNAANSATENDVVAFTNVSAAGMTVTNITAFPVATPVQRFFGSSTITPATSAASQRGLRLTLSPDGTRVAFLGGANTVASPAVLYVARIDGSQAGTLVPVTAGKFDAQVIYMGDVNFVSNNTVLFLAGTNNTLPPTAPAADLDLYAFDVGSGNITNLTKTTTGSTVPPFTQGGNTGNILDHGSCSSLNGNWWYLSRGHTTALIKNFVGVNTATLALKDITGSEFSAGTAPAIYRGGTTHTTDPWIALEYSMRRAPGSTRAFFVAENAAGASSTVLNDANLFSFDIENGGQATQLTNYTGSGSAAATINIQHLAISPDGNWLAYAVRRGVGTGDGPENVFVLPATGGTERQLSISQPTQTVCDGSIRFTGGSVNGVAWAVGTGASNSVPTVNAVAQWSLVTGQNGPLNLTAYPVATPAKVVMILNANATNL